MPYKLTLRSRSSTPIQPESLRETLLAQGLAPQVNISPPGLLGGDCPFLCEIVSTPEIPAGVKIAANIPYGLDYFDFTGAVCDIQELGEATGCDIIFRNTPFKITADGVGLYLSFVIGADYDEASQAAIALFGVANAPPPTSGGGICPNP